MNGKDKITVIETKMASVQERRRIISVADTTALRCLNDAIQEKDCKDAIDEFARSLKDLRNGS